eukprot:Phypoly_transcript_02542.p1 GENE.Phypoly_transcript_02542~~Phypoly_transcript_02542.p1  ORF type:complete len:853 (+),score=183.31 Phypoly_transcript_02542:119-2677(+)
MGNSPSKKNKNATSTTPANKTKLKDTPSAPPPATTSVSTNPPSSHHAHVEKTPSHHAVHTPDPAPAANSPSKSEPVDSKGFSSKKVEELFDKYKDTNPYGILQAWGENENIDDSGKMKIDDRTQLDPKEEKTKDGGRGGRKNKLIRNLLGELEGENRGREKEAALDGNHPSQAHPKTQQAIMSSPSDNGSPKRMRVEGNPSLEIDVDMEEVMEMAQAAMESIQTRAREIAIEAIGNENTAEFRDTMEAARSRLMEEYMESERKKREAERGEKERAKEEEERKRKEREAEKERRRFQRDVEKKKEEERRRRNREENMNPGPTMTATTTTTKTSRLIRDTDDEATEEDESEKERRERRERTRRDKRRSEESEEERERRREEEESEEERIRRRERRERERKEKKRLEETRGRERTQSRTSVGSNRSSGSGGSGGRRERSQSRGRSESRTGSLREKVARSKDIPLPKRAPRIVESRNSSFANPDSSSSDSDYFNDDPRRQERRDRQMRKANEAIQNIGNEEELENFIKIYSQEEISRMVVVCFEPGMSISQIEAAFGALGVADEVDHPIKEYHEERGWGIFSMCTVRHAQKLLDAKIQGVRVLPAKVIDPRFNHLSVLVRGNMSALRKEEVMEITEGALEENVIGGWWKGMGGGQAYCDVQMSVEELETKIERRPYVTINGASFRFEAIIPFEYYDETEAVFVRNLGAAAAKQDLKEILGRKFGFPIKGVFLFKNATTKKLATFCRVYLSSKNQVKAAIKLSATFKVFGKTVIIQRNLPQEELKAYKEERGEQGIGRYSREAERRAYRGEQNVAQQFSTPLFINGGNGGGNGGRGAGKGRIPELEWGNNEERARRG